MGSLKNLTFRDGGGGGSRKTNIEGGRETT